MPPAYAGNLLGLDRLARAGRLHDGDAVLLLAALLCSPAMSFANGSSYVLDGGWTAR
ncbi:MAG TPA: hypothetical protein VF838_00455 [Trebonia sp.]